MTSINRLKTHCPRGHEYTEENTYRKPLTGKRDCRICMAERERNRRYVDRDRGAYYAENHTCRHGHLMDERNTYWHIHKGTPTCRACTTARVKNGRSQ